MTLHNDTSVKIIIAEDHELLREGLVSLINSTNNYSIISQAADGLEAFNETLKLRPNLLLADLGLPILNGYELIRRIKVHIPELVIVVLSVHDEEESVRMVLNAGASGYVVKDDTKEHLFSAIQSALNGKLYLSPTICNYAITSKKTPANVPLDSPSARYGLTNREYEVLDLIVHGFKNRTIADQLYVSIKTIEKHRTSIMQKLDVHNAAQLTLFAMQHDLVEFLDLSNYKEIPIKH